MPNIKGLVPTMAIAVGITFGLSVGLYWLVGLFTQDVGWQLIITAVMVHLLREVNSGSSMARVFWSSVPQSIILLCAIFAIGSLLPVLLLVAVVTAVLLLEYAIARKEVVVI